MLDWANRGGRSSTGWAMACEAAAGRVRILPGAVAFRLLAACSIE